jgi:hypothetical protein
MEDLEQNEAHGEAMGEMEWVKGERSEYSSGILGRQRSLECDRARRGWQTTAYLQLDDLDDGQYRMLA